jgi:hypothetical protein
LSKKQPAPSKHGRGRRSDPSVFIVESVAFEDEDARHLEGSILSDLLRLSEKETEYRYLRTKQEFRKVLKQFQRSNKRYLHISCHGNEQELWTTLDPIPFGELAEMLAPYLKGRRLFISACAATNKYLAQQVMSKSECLSIIGPAGDISFGDAAIMWASFYHLMFRLSNRGMRSENIKDVLSAIATTYQVPLKYFPRSEKKPYFTQRTFSGKKLT